MGVICLHVHGELQLILEHCHENSPHMHTGPTDMLRVGSLNTAKGDSSCCVNTLLSLAGNLGFCSRKSDAAHSYQCVQYHCVQTVVWLVVLGIFNMRIDAECMRLQPGAVRTPWKSALEVDSGRKIPCRTENSSLCPQLLRLSSTKGGICDTIATKAHATKRLHWQHVILFCCCFYIALFSALERLTTLVRDSTWMT